MKITLKPLHHEVDFGYLDIPQDFKYLRVQFINQIAFLWPTTPVCQLASVRTMIKLSKSLPLVSLGPSEMTLASARHGGTLSVIPATREVEAGRLQIGDQPQLTFEPS
jgi:hypothetical protein